jgi:hypothetical protein
LGSNVGFLEKYKNVQIIILIFKKKFYYLKFILRLFEIHIFFLLNYHFKIEQR